jgi:hypothetical protein
MEEVVAEPRMHTYIRLRIMASSALCSEQRKIQWQFAYIRRALGKRCISPSCAEQFTPSEVIRRCGTGGTGGLIISKSLWRERLCQLGLGLERNPTSIKTHFQTSPNACLETGELAKRRVISPESIHVIANFDAITDLLSTAF